ncbi:MAG: phenylalanine--tRNA ligase subunit beta [bacterium]
MRLPIGWLRDYVTFNANAQELADKLTFSGLEVEAIETTGGNYTGVIAARVLAILPHPNADKLVLCDIDKGSGQDRVVCGAHNFKVGDMVPFAGPGTTLPNGMHIKDAVIRGEKSGGMLCAEDELGISPDHTGLMILPPDTRPGAPLTEVIPPETILTIEVTPNRPDCLSIIGIAREVATLYGTQLKLPSVDFAETGQPVEELVRVEVKDREKCLRYTARCLKNVTISPSPLQIRMRLMHVGVRPINNIVDITNYVMFECGQPLHAFDRALLKDGHIVVRRARAGETMATLDGIERKPSPDMLLIADLAAPVAVAGVMGGAGSEIRDNTAEVLLESACFLPASIRRTSKMLGLSTESSYRYERGVDPELADYASRRAAQLMITHAGAVAATGVIDVYPRKAKTRSIRCRFDNVRALTGVSYTTEDFTAVFESLGLKVARITRTGCTVLVPSRRPDLEIEADLAEEVMRINGLDKVPVHEPRSSYVSTADDTTVRAAGICGRAAAGLGLTETLNYSFVSEQLLNVFDTGTVASRVVLPNPVSADQSVMRPSLIPQMAATLGYNLARQATEASLFEIGRVFTKDSAGNLGEETRLAIGLLGPVGRSGLDKRRPVEADEMFLWAKGALESMCSALGAPAFTLDAGAIPWAEQGKSARIAIASGEGATAIGVVGILKHQIRAEWRMARPVALLEVKLSALLKGVFVPSVIKPLAAYPAVTRDIAILVDASVRHEDVVKVVLKDAPHELTRLDLFDIYCGAGVPAGKKSLAYSLTYRSLDRTLTDEEANRLHDTVRGKIVSDLKAEVRES